MCGIFATLRTDGARACEQEVRRGTRALAHRGPDGEGWRLAGPAGVGIRRLAIVDPASGHQPFVSDDERTVLVGNGELYEADALRESLRARGAIFRTRSDIEVALHVYLADGIEAVGRLRGMFALAIWDGRRGELLVARDRFGIKPAFWQHDGPTVRVASEPQALAAASGAPLALGPRTLERVLTFGYVPGPGSAFAQVRAVPPGHLLRVRLGGDVTIEPLLPTDFDPDEYASRTGLIDASRDALEDSVAHHLRSDVPVGAFLSSGVDSSALVALARRHIELPTFSIGVADTGDESELAATTAAALDVEHRRRHLGPADIFGALPEALRNLGPVADPSAIALYHLSAFAREHVPVVLSGEGADELFGGYRIYRQPGASRPVQVLPAWARRSLNASAHRSAPGRRGRGYLLRASTGVEAWYRGNVTTTDDHVRRQLLRVEGWRGFEPRGDLAHSWRRSRHLDAVTRMQTVDLDTWLPGDILAKADRVSMAHGLEVRVPFLDEHVWSVARRVPTRLRLAGGTTKYILRRAVDDLLPSAVAARPKLGFPVPVGKWLRGSWGIGVADRVNGGPLGTHFHADAVRQVVADHRDGRADHGRLVWALLTLTVWAEQTLDRRHALTVGSHAA